MVDDRQFLLSYFGRADMWISVRLGVATDASYPVSDVDEIGADCKFDGDCGVDAPPNKLGRSPWQYCLDRES